jgi:hypothetical protein
MQENSYNKKSFALFLIIGFVILVLIGLAIGLYFLLRNNNKATTKVPTLSPTTSPGPTTRPPTTSPGPTNSAFPSNVFSIEHNKTGLCWHPDQGGSNPTNGTKVVLYSGCNLNRLHWELLPSGNIKHVESGKCLKVDSSNPSNAPAGTDIILDDVCNNTLHQFEYNTNEKSFRHKQTGMCIHPHNNGLLNGTKLVLFDGCNLNQTIFNKLNPINDIEEYFLLKNDKRDKCIDTEGGRAEEAKRLNLLGGCTDSENTDFMLFKITSNGSLQNSYTGRCVHVEGGAFENENVENNTRLGWYGGCNEYRTKFEFLPNGAIKHVSSGKCIHPLDTEGPELVLFDGCTNIDYITFSKIKGLKF